MGKRRDDFSLATIENLRARVNNRCLNPCCRVPTTGPSEDPEKVNTIGIAAHITAAAPGGPRYDKYLSSNHRRNIRNGIWLCSNCSRDIDNDPVKYTKEALIQWKKKAENTVSVELGSRLPDDEHVRNTLATVISSVPGIFILDAIKNVHKALGRAIENLAPRFKIKTKFVDDTTEFHVHALENVSFRMTVGSQFREEFVKKYLEFEAYGVTVNIDGQAASFEGIAFLDQVG